MSVAPGRRGAIAFFVTSCVCLVALAAAMNVGWVVMNWREVVPLLLGVPVFAALITGLILNTTFLVREIQRNEQHNAFVNAVTHELKTPVTSIRLHLETLKARGASIDEARRREFCDLMLADSDRLLQTIDQILRTGQAGRVPLHRARLNIRALVEDSVALFLRQHHLPVEAVHIAPSAAGAEPVEVIGDENLLRGAIMNLLDNAVKFSREHVDVEVTVAPVGSHAAVRVRDHGPGLAPDELRRIFKRFYRIPGPLTQRVKGTGLGLFIVDDAARQHRGRAYAESAGLGHGSTFSLELPLAPAARP